MGCCSTQSMRERPPAEVSPLTPALTTSTAMASIAEQLLDHSRKGLGLGETEPGGEAVAEDDDANGRGNW